MTSFKTMLAATAPPLTAVVLPVLGSPKLDGVRNHVLDSLALSRKLLSWKNPELQRRYGRAKFNGLDGEFIYGSPTADNVARLTNGMVSRHVGNMDLLKMHVFDDFSDPRRPFWQRLERAKARIAGDDRFQIVEHRLLRTLEEVEWYETEQVELGYEGIMLRHPDGPYKYGRSTKREGWLMKVKRFVDGEARILDAEELHHNDNEKTLVANGKAKRNSKKEGMVAGGVLGALVCEDLKGKFKMSFNVGSGFDAAERRELWALHQEGKLVGNIIRYKYFPIGLKDKPKWPTFVCFRDRADL